MSSLCCYRECTKYGHSRDTPVSDCGCFSAIRLDAVPIVTDSLTTSFRPRIGLFAIFVRCLSGTGTTRSVVCSARGHGGALCPLCLIEESNTQNRLGIGRDA